ncbi:MAG: hypothetical protein KA807_07940 [Prolixibacteraceae bacterium]|jgi:hypothetical protein|nr:hypothetical protein [Prolixibacteraceae bacterium]
MNPWNINVIRNLSNLAGWKTSRKLLVLESDDWGSIRMPSRDVYESLIQAGFDLTSDDGARFNKYDTLASYEDLSCLFEILTSFKDQTGRPPVFTPVAVVANPDFEKIIRSDFSHYFYEPFNLTLTRYSGCEKSFDLWLEGINKRLFVPQFHGREHLNVKIWLKTLKEGNEKTLTAFKNGMWGFSTTEVPEINAELQAAFDFIDTKDLIYHEEVIVTGLMLFYQIFGYRATYFVPPNGPFSSKLEPVCAREGIRYIATSKIQNEPLGQGRIKRNLHWIGQRNRNGLIYITRNCFFEPSQPGLDWVGNCLSDIAIAFKWGKPAVISTHRVNYIGSLYRINRENGLKQLECLLKQIIKNWPDVEFISSAELGEIINNERFDLQNNAQANS